ncbi:MAG: rRNA maturation RNase YbeY [Bacteroidota bacterium]
MISFNFVETKAFKIKRNDLKVNIKKLIEAEKLKVGDVSFVFCSDDYLLEINKTHLNHDYYTDIITFDYCEGKIVSGDLFISIDRVLENSSNISVNFANELSRVMFHGVLHLCSYKDKTPEDKKIMTKKEDFYLSLLGVDYLV